MKILKAAGHAICVAFLVACGPSPTSLDTSVHQQPASGLPDGDELVEVEVPGSSNALLWFKPESLSACASGKDVVTVSWDVTAVSDTLAVKVLLVDIDGAETLFAATGPAGVKDTGSWASGGSTMAVRDAVTGKELSRATIGTIPCETNAPK